MTLLEIKNSDKDMLTPNDIAEIIGCKPYTISVQVKEDKENCINSFPFPTIKIGSRTRIPRLPFLKAMGVNVEE